jgi:formylglycine-generating enzyme required for sulfatase activity
LSIVACGTYAQGLKPYEQDIPNTPLKFKMIAIPAGKFTMGSSFSETGRDEDEGPQKVVEVSAFWMGAYEVTFDLWDAFFKNMDVPQTKAIAVDAVSRPTAQYIDLTWGMDATVNNPQTA